MKKFLGKMRFAYAVCAVLWFCIKGHIAGLFTDKEAFYRKRIGPDAFKLLKGLKSTVDITGLENLDPKKTYIFMGNHRSYTDILIMYLAMATAKREIVFMSKQEVFNVPLLGATMRSLGIIGVDRSNTADAFRSLIKAIDKVKHGRDLVIFPEGTRSVTGELLPLKRGGFILAARSGLDIAPFVIHESEKFMPKGEFAIYPTHAYIKFLPTVANNGRKDKELLGMVETAIKNAI